MDRTAARTAALKLIYEWTMGGDGGAPTRFDLLGVKADEDGAEYMETLFAGVRSHAGALDALIAQYARDWTIERIMRVDLTILRIAVYEMIQLKLEPGIAINEAVELARAYSTPEATSFVNGVLGNLAREQVRP